MIIPPHYAMIHGGNEEKETPQEYFHRKYVEILDKLSEVVLSD